MVPKPHQSAWSILIAKTWIWSVDVENIKPRKSSARSKEKGKKIFSYANMSRRIWLYLFIHRMLLRIARVQTNGQTPACLIALQIEDSSMWSRILWIFYEAFMIISRTKDRRCYSVYLSPIDSYSSAWVHKSLSVNQCVQSHNGSLHRHQS